MKRFTAFSFVLITVVLLAGYLTLWSPQIYAHTDLGTSPVFKITENTRGPVRLNLPSQNIELYSIASTDADSQKFEISPEKRGPNHKRWQELRFKSDNVPDYENPADADTDNDYEITLAYGVDGSTHNHDVTIRVTNVAAPDKMSAPTLEVLMTDVNVSWTAVSHASLTGYEVHWVNTSDASDTDSETVADTSTSTTLEYLTGGDTYNIKVRALSSEGNSEWSDTAQITANSAPTLVGTIPAQVVAVSGGTASINAQNYFNDPDGQELNISASSSDTTVATVTENSGMLTITGKNTGTATITVTATDPFNSVATQTVAVSVKNPPTAVGTMPDIAGALNQVGGYITLSGYFSDPDGQTLTYSAASSSTYVCKVSISTNSLQVIPQRVGSATITVTAANPDGLSATQSFSVTFTETVFVGEADAIPSLSSQELSQFSALLTYDTLIFNELHNGSDDANDWLELRNVSTVDIPLDSWQLTIQTGSATAIIPFPVGTVIPTGEVLLLTNTEMAIADALVLSVVAETFALPQTDFALILRSATAFGDVAGNYVQGEPPLPETLPVLTVDTAWDRTQPVVFGYRAAAWGASTHRNGLGSPGYQPSAVAGDLNNDGVVNILDLVLVASKIGTTGITAADLNGDMTVNIQDLVLVANALSNDSAAPTPKQSAAATVNNWLHLALQNESKIVRTSVPTGFSYTRGIEVLEQLAKALTPNKTALLANYPNPFNPETWIPYQLSKAADVTVTIYASDGHVVRTLALGHQDVGTYKNRSQAAYWDGKNEIGESVASGVYFYTLTAGDFSATRKMLILK